MMYYQIYKTADCPKGWAYVRDYQGNKVFYGTLEECHKFIDQVTGFLNDGNDERNGE